MKLLIGELSYKMTKNVALNSYSYITNTRAVAGYHCDCSLYGNLFEGEPKLKVSGQLRKQKRANCSC